MATTPTVVQETPVGQIKLPVLSLVIAVVLGVLLSVAVIGGAGYYLVHSGKLKLQTATPQAEATPKAPEKTHAVVLEPLVVNLADSAGGAYLRASITLNIADAKGSPKDEKKAEDAKAGKEMDAAVRDTALTVLGQQTSDGLLAADGKDRLKRELKAALAARNPDVKVTDLFFTEFLVQR